MTPASRSWYSRTSGPSPFSQLKRGVVSSGRSHKIWAAPCPPRGAASSTEDVLLWEESGKSQSVSVKTEYCME